MRNKGVRLLGFLMLLVVVGGSSSMSRRVQAASLIMPMEVTDGDCIGCVHGGCEEGFHDAFETSPPLNFWTRNGGVHNGTPCMEGTCYTNHGPWNCGGAEPITLGDVETIRLALVRNDSRGLEQLMQEHPGRIVFNSARAALQVFGCGGEVLAHFPVELGASF